ncbi:MAG: Ig-like domain-containing protein [Treponema sp.]|nr:Ig-like domain-containing protein [Treponema sp.]
MSKSFGFGLLKKAFGCFALSALLFAGCSSGDESSSSSSSEANTSDGSAVTAVSVSASPSTMDSATGTSTITATITGDDSAAVSWSITSGGDYATLGSSSTNASGGKAAVTLTGKNTTASEQSVTVKATAGSKSGTVTVKVPASAGGTNTSSGVTSVTLNQTSLNLLADTTATLTATVATTSSDIAKTVTWTSSDENVATVSDGTVTAVAAGTATITATSTADTTKKATCDVTVESADSSEVLWRADEYEAQTISSSKELGMMTVLASSDKNVIIDENNKSIDGYSFTKRVKLSGGGSSETRALKFTTTDSAKITVYFMSGSSTESRTLTLYSGSTSIASGSNGGSSIGSFSTSSNVSAGTYLIYSDKACNIYAVKIAYENAQTTVYPTAISLDKTSLSLDVSDDSTTKTATLTATIENASEVTSGKDTIEWASSDKSVATVSDGVVTAKKAGTATITASCTYGGASATCAVTVTGTATANVIRASDAPTGWAAYTGAPTSWGGFGGTVYDNVDTYDKLKTALSGSSSRIIYITGEIDLCNGKTGYDFIKEAGYENDYTSYADYQTKFGASCSDGSASTLASVQSACSAKQKATMQISIPSNTTIIGKTENAGFKNGVVSLYNVTNVVIRNLTIKDAYDYFPSWYQSNENNFNAEWDNLVINGSTYVWIDHCTLKDSSHTYAQVTVNGGSRTEDWVTYDGLLDVVNGSNYVTLSYNKFENHDKTTLIGNSDSKTSDDGKLKVTVHHNYYTGCTQRLPRVRFGQVHIYNNYYESINMYCIGVGKKAQIYSEKNCFPSSAKLAYKSYSSDGCLTEKDDANETSASASGYSAANWTPSSTSGYSYDAEETTNLATTVPANAGSGVWTVQQ